jgi:hypothetical protein
MSLELTDPHRRALLLAAAAAVSCEFVAPPRAAGQAPPGNGAVGDFNFLAGSWKIRHRRLKTGGTAPVWDEFDGEATCVTVLGGAGSIEELRIPARDFSGLGIRLLDPATRLWADYWVNGKERVIGAPGLTGSYHEGAGIFVPRMSRAPRRSRHAPCGIGSRPVPLAPVDLARRRQDLERTEHDLDPRWSRLREQAGVALDRVPGWRVWWSSVKRTS